MRNTTEENTGQYAINFFIHTVLAVLILGVYLLLPAPAESTGCPDGKPFTATVTIQPGMTTNGMMMSVHSQIPSVPYSELAWAAERFSEFTGVEPSAPLRITAPIGVCVQDGKQITRVGSVNVKGGPFN